MSIKNTIIIGISAVSGGGKTTVINELKKIIPKSEALYFDDYDFDGPASIVKWVEEGADYNLWDLSPMINAINQLLNDESKEIQYLFLDYPFARKHNEMSAYLDYTIYIDTPLDIAFARRLIRDYSNTNSIEIVNDAKFYISKGRVGYEEMVKTIKPNSDYVIDGTLDLEMITESIEKLLGSI